MCWCELVLLATLGCASHHGCIGLVVICGNDVQRPVAQKAKIADVLAKLLVMGVTF